MLNETPARRSFVPLILGALLAVVPAIAGTVKTPASRSRTGSTPTAVPRLSLGLTTPSLAPSLAPAAAGLDNPATPTPAVTPAQRLAVAADARPASELVPALTAAGLDAALAKALAEDVGVTDRQDPPLLLAKMLKDAQLPTEEKKALLLAAAGAKLEVALQAGLTPKQLEAARRDARVLFASEAAPFIGSVESAERHLERAGGDRMAVYGKLQGLIESPQADLLPIGELANLTGNALHFQEVKQKGLPAPEKAAAVTADLDAARRYIKSVMGDRKPTERETDALLLDYLEMKGISARSEQARSLRAGLLPRVVAAEKDRMAGVSPAMAAHETVLLRVSDERGIPVGELAAAYEKLRIGANLPSEQVERALNQIAERRELDAVTGRYPNTEQGRLMREVASTMLARGGKSVEEIARDGVFIYADFAGSQVGRVSVGRDPDPTTPQMIFYIVRNGDKWKLSGYRQNRRLGRSDASLIRDFVQWLDRGGVPESDFLN